MLRIDFTLFVRFVDRYYVATIPKSRFEFLLFFIIFFVISSVSENWYSHLSRLTVCNIHTISFLQSPRMEVHICSSE